jgi:acyl-CoA thioesterase II
MVVIESAWPKYPGYAIDLIPYPGRVRVWFGDLLIAESTAALRVEETKHVDRIYLPESDVRFDLFEPNDHHTICPFKGQADYWTLTATDPPTFDLLWSYPAPMDEVAGLKGYIGIYHEKTRVEIEEVWAGTEPEIVTTNRFPAWGDAADLVHLIDVEPNGPGRYLGPTYRDLTRNVVEGGQLLAQAIVAASKTVPHQKVTSAYMIFSKAASFDAPIDLGVEVLRGGRTFSTVEVRAEQNGQIVAPALLLFDQGAPDAMAAVPPMPDVPGPEEAVPYDMRVTGRELRIVDAAYDPDPERVGPPEIFAWMRFRESPAEEYLERALIAQSTTHFTLAASMRPHKGFGEADAHLTLSTGVMSIAIAFHERASASEWLLYAHSAYFAGGGLVQGDGKVFTQDGRLVASINVQAMVRAFAQDPHTIKATDRVM